MFHKPVTYIVNLQLSLTKLWIKLKSLIRTQYKHSLITNDYNYNWLVKLNGILISKSISTLLVIITDSKFFFTIHDSKLSVESHLTATATDPTNR